jgi:DNA polymerase
MSVMHLDFETFSPLDLKKVGTENYVRAPGFAVTALAWAFDDGPVQFRVWPDTALPLRVWEHIEAGGTIRAWNAAFERTILRLHYGLHYGIDVAAEQMDCVMQRALAFGLPAALQEAGDALKLGIVKDVSARRLMLQMGRPKPDGSEWHEDPSPAARAKLADLAAYCRQDVEAERALDRHIPPLDPREKALSVVDFKINDAGVLVDLQAVEALAKASAHELDLLNQECARLTGGAVTSPGTQGERLLAWLAATGTVLPDLTKATVAAALVGGSLKAATAARVLEIRQLAAKASVSKLARMAAQASSHDGRARQQLQFYGAGRTGRWAGRGIQIQNLPRPAKDLNPAAVIRVAQADPEGVGMLWANPMKAISGSLRGCLVAGPGMRLVSIDLSQIEARVLAWLAGQADVLDTFRRGLDVYTMQAAKVGSYDRQLGKVLVLACGFGMGAVKFRETAAEQYGLKLTAAEALAALGAWRTNNRRIVTYWKDLQQVVEHAVRNPGVIVHSTHGVAVRQLKGYLLLKKPNGVKLAYQNMRLGRGGLEFDGVDAITKQWGTQRTYGGKLVENLTQSVARDVMAEALVASETAGLRPIATIHDEIVWEVPETVASSAAVHLQKLVETVPGWAAGLPLASEVKISTRYGK